MHNCNCLIRPSVFLAEKTSSRLVRRCWATGSVMSAFCNARDSSSSSRISSNVTAKIFINAGFSHQAEKNQRWRLRGGAGTTGEDVCSKVLLIDLARITKNAQI
jgi:hypothetical protein